MTLVRPRPGHDHLELAATLLRECRTYFVDSRPVVAAATTAVAELETLAARGYPSSALARRWRVSRVFRLARELRDGLAGVRLMVESATAAAGGTTAGSVLLRRRLADLDDALRDLRTEPWSLPDHRIVEQLRSGVASEDLTRARRELARASALLEQVLVEITTALET